MRSFVIEDLFLDLLGVVLIEFSNFTACRIGKKAIVLHEMHWKRIGTAGIAKEWAIVHFRVSVVTENSLSRQRFAGFTPRQWL